MVAVVLPRVQWGDPSSAREVLMLHGLGSSAHTCWHLMEALAQEGWYATAVDLRGHGSAPRTSSYLLDDFAQDVEQVTPSHGGAWDLVIGHSIGAATAIVASAQHPTWAQSLILLDPAVKLDGATRNQVLDNQRLGHSAHGVAEVTALHPHWHPLDIQIKVDAHRAASLWALERAVLDNDPWDVEEEARALTIATHAIGAQPDLGSMFYGEAVEELLAFNPNWTYEILSGAGHSVHRDKPEETLQAVRRVLGSEV
jgi:pimeloyl-ACP methyl ester carboxylesterase